MWDSADTTVSNTLAGFNSQISFYEYPSHKPFINSIHQPLRPSQTLSSAVALPESNRDNLLTALQSLSFRIKKLENERERAESSLREITGGISGVRSRDSFTHFDGRKCETSDHNYGQDSRNSMTNHRMNIDRSGKSRLSRKKKRSLQRNESVESGIDIHPDGRHYHLDMNTVPFILGASTSPSYNVKSNVQNVFALLKKHNHQLCLSSKEYAELLNPHVKGDLPPHTLLYLDHYNKSPIRPSSASPTRSIRRQRASSVRRAHSATRRPQTAILSNQQCYSRIKILHQEFAKLAREHKRLNQSRTNSRELEIIGERMKIILEELERLQKQLKVSIRDGLSRDHLFPEQVETPLETLRKTRLIQILLKDSNKKEDRRRRSHRRFRPNSYD